MTEKSLIPICSWCKKIRTEDMSWKSIDMYLADIGFGVFTHGMCPDCAEKYFEKRAYLESYQNICKAISVSLSLEEVLSLIVTNVVKVMNVKASMLRLLDKNTNKLEVAAYYGLSEEYVNKGLVVTDASIADALSGKAVSVYDIQSDPDATYKSAVEKEGIRSILSIPLRLNNEVIGVLRMYTAEPVKYSKEDLKFVTAITDQAAIAINNARIFEKTISKEKQYLRVFEEVTKAVSSTLDLEEVLNLIVQKLPAVMNLKAATIRLLGRTGEKTMACCCAWPFKRISQSGYCGYRGKCERGAAAKKPVAIYDVTKDPRIKYQREAEREGIKSMLTLPIIARGKLIGIMRLLTDEFRHFNDEEIRFTASLAEVCGTAIDNARLYEALKRKEEDR